MDPAAWIGKTIDGRYVVESVLGVGGMGTVLRAKHAFTGMPVAVKLLRPELQLDPDIQTRFLAEAKAPNAIGHPAIVQVLDAGRTADGLLYMAMELLVGRSMRVALQRRELSPEVGRRVVLDLLVALGHAHSRGFIHRDLKPDNVFLCGAGYDVKLLDFGIAKVLDDVRRTSAGALLGTPAYMAPEQLADASGVDNRADLWAIGVIVYEMMTGRLPLPATTPNEMLVALASAEPTPIRTYLFNVSREVEQFFERALARDPRRRFGAAAELAQALAPLPVTGAIPSPSAPAPVTSGHPLSIAAPVGTVPQAPSAMPPLSITPHTVPEPDRQGPSKALWIVAALAVVLIVVGIAIAFSGKKEPRVAAQDAASPPDADAVVVTPDPSPIKEEPKSCDQKCDWLQKECGTRVATCESECKNRPVAFDECFTRSENSCRDGATCGFEKLCRQVPAGNARCADVAACELKCSSGPCICACAAKLAPAHTLELARFNACWSRAATTDCANLQGQAFLVCLGTVCRAEGQACELAKL